MIEIAIYFDNENDARRYIDKFKEQHVKDNVKIIEIDMGIRRC